MNRRATVRTEASVVVTAPVPGTTRRRTPKVTGRNSEVTTITAHPLAMAAARAAQRPGERIVIISETRVDLVPA